MYFHILGQIIEDNGGGMLATLGLAKQLAKEIGDSSADMSAETKKDLAENLRGWIRRNIEVGKTSEAKNFLARYRVGTGPRAKWADKNAMS